MNRWVIDTNVPIAANIPIDSSVSRKTVSPWCVEQAVEFLCSLSRKDCILLDSCDEILDEYRRHLKYSGQPGPGDRFFQMLQICEIPSDLIDLPLNSEGEYEDLPDEIAKSAFDKESEICGYSGQGKRTCCKRNG